jgi:catechol 2,3-dioxygenase-like lactoylglutathione lyase family enzyme
MGVDRLQHINIRTRDLERSREFYSRIVGLTVGDRPPFAAPGYWMYLGDQAVIHLVYKPEAGPATGSGAVDHVAFRAVDLEETRRVLQAAGLSFQEAFVPRDNVVQLFVHDPDGVKVELNFEQS